MHTKGTLPGGVDMEALQKLTANQEMMEIMSNPKLQVRRRLWIPVSLCFRFNKILVFSLVDVANGIY